MNLELADAHSVFLSTLLAGRGERRLALVAVLASVMGPLPNHEYSHPNPQAVDRDTELDFETRSWSTESPQFARDVVKAVCSYSLGANSYVRKPVDFAEFMEAVRVLDIYWMMMNQPPPGGNTA